MKKIFLVFLTMFIAGGAMAQKGVVINGVTWATHNVGEPGKFVANPEDYGNYYTFRQAQTACPEGWRMPTMEESTSLADCEKQWTTLNGVAGMKLGAGDDSIFLPAAGRIKSRYSYLFVGNTGFYWTATKATLRGGYNMLIYDGFVGPRGVIRFQNRLSARCVKQ